MSNHPNRRAVATIAHNDPEITRRVHLYVRRLDADSDGARYAIVTGSGEDAGQYRWPTRAEAIAAIDTLWGASVEWDLQYT